MNDAILKKYPFMIPLSFLTFCIELYAEHKNLPSPEIYQLFKKTGLMGLLKTDYEDLHGMSFEYLMQFFDEYLQAPAVVAEKPDIYLEDK